MENKLPSGWQVEKLSDIAHLIGGGTPSKQIDSYFSGNILWATVRDMNVNVIEDTEIKISESGLKDSSSKIVPKENIIIATRVGVGKVCRNKFDTAINQDLRGVCPNNQTDVQYLFYFLKSISTYLQSISTGATVKGIRVEQVAEIQVPLPPLAEQRRIVAKLDSLFARIDRAVVLVEQNIANAQHLIASMLNDVFDGLDCAKMKLQDSCIINPPKSEVKSTGNLEVSFLPMADLNAHQIDFIPKQTKRIAEVYTGYTYFKNGDVLLAKVTPCFENGKAGLADNLVNGIGFGSSEYIVLRAKQAVLPAYVYYNLTSSEFLRQGAQNMSGAVGLKRVTKDFLFNYEIPIPSIDVQGNVVKYFTNQTTKLSELTSRLEERLTKLKALKSSLLDSAFKGEL
jgi:restriction endonuclease S subunit